jgi:4-hydroxybenzoyl-CoA thioesterase
VRRGNYFHKRALWRRRFCQSVISFSRSSFNVEHRVRLRDHLCAEGAETRVWIVREATGALKSSPIPPDVMEKFQMPSPIN